MKSTTNWNALGERIEKMQREKGYWSASGVSSKGVKWAVTALEKDTLDFMIVHDGMESLVWVPPVRDYDDEQDRLARLLDDEEFLTTGNFRNPAYGNMEDFIS